jgi:aminoglycoside 3-N-acetyltransferase
LSSLGWVCGGATAVVQALRDALTRSGTIVVPAQTAWNRDPVDWRDPAVDECDWDVLRASIPGYEPAVTPSHGMGVIAEQVRTWPGARRSAHPQTSFAALGPRAEELLAGHDLESPLGDRSPLGRLADADARVLLLGVGMDRNTSFHLAEYRLPDRSTRVNGCAIMDGPVRRWVRYPGIRLIDGDFHQLGKAFENETDEVVMGRVGEAQCRLFPVRSAVRFAERWMLTHRGYT